MSFRSGLTRDESSTDPPLNSQASWTDPSGHYKVTAYGDNLTKVKYRITFNGNSATGDYNSWSEPRTYGVRMGYSF